MTDASSPSKRRPRAPTASKLEQQLLDEVLELKGQVNHLAVAIERQTNAIAQTQMLAARDIVTLTEKVNLLDAWRDEVEKERAEQRGGRQGAQVHAGDRRRLRRPCGRCHHRDRELHSAQHGIDHAKSG